MYIGCFPVLQFNPSDTLIIDQEPALKGLVQHPRDENAALQNIQQAIDDSEYRQQIAQKGSELIQRHYMGDGWKEYLASLYRISAAVVTTIRPISEMDFAGLRNSERQNDFDAAYMSKSFFGDSVDFLFSCLLERIDAFSIPDAMKIYFSLLKQPQQLEQQIKIRQLLYFVRKKLSR